MTTTTAQPVTLSPNRATRRALRRSGDRKVTPVIRRQSSKDSAILHNAFGLPAGISCPGRTAFCRDCYALRTENVFKASGTLVSENYATLAGATLSEMVELLSEMITDYVRDADRLISKGRMPESARIFRIHWDGDYFSETYAAAWSVVVRMFPTVHFWSYTRSFAYVSHLVGAANHAVYLSVDSENVGAAAAVLSEYPSLRVAACGTTQAQAQAVAVSLGRKAMACPENVGRMSLVMPATGRGELAVGSDGRGACVACGLCVFGKRDVAFATTGK